jgi:hypothetical protein
LTSPALETECPLKSPADSPLITKPPVPVAMADNSMGSAPCLPNTTYDLPASNASTGANAEIWVQKDVILTVAQRGFVINGESTHDHSGRH